jgi:hypothetical protein
VKRAKLSSDVPRRAERAMRAYEMMRLRVETMTPMTIVLPLVPMTMVPKMKVPITIVLPLVPMTMAPKMKANKGCGCACR